MNNAVPVQSSVTPGVVLKTKFVLPSSDAFQNYIDYVDREGAKMDAKKEAYDIKEVIMTVDNDKVGKDFIQTMKCFIDLKEDIPTDEKD